MEVSEVVAVAVQVVQEIGFPIAVAVALFILLYREMQDRKQRDAETMKIISENTSAIHSLRELVQSLHGS